MVNALALPGDAMERWQVMTQQADMLVQSGFLPRSVDTAAKAVAIIMQGEELGIGAWAALNGISVIQQKPTISPQLMLALINRTGQLENIEITGDAKGCSVTMKRKGRSPHTETFTMQDAAAMQLATKDNWKKQPAVMLKWRAVAACCRVVFPDAIAGMYTPDEMGAETNEDGEVITTHTPQLPTNVDTSTGEITVTTPVPTTPELSLLKDAATEVLEGEEVTDEPTPAAVTAAANALNTPPTSDPKSSKLDQHFGPKKRETDADWPVCEWCGQHYSSPGTPCPSCAALGAKQGDGMNTPAKPNNNPHGNVKQTGLLKTGDDGTRSADEIQGMCANLYTYANQKYPQLSHDDIHTIFDVKSMKEYFATKSPPDARAELDAYMKQAAALAKKVS